MNTLLVKDLPRVDELDRETARSVRGGMLTIKAPEPPAWLKLPPVTMPAQVTLPLHPVVMPYDGPMPTQDPRLQ
jgi:hypothetical protein